MNKTELRARNEAALAARRPGDVIFFHPVSYNFFANTILYFTQQFYHHGAIVISDTQVIEADPFEGVHISDLDKYLESYILDLYRLDGDRSEDGIVEAAMYFKGWGYDYGNVLWAGLGWAFYWLTDLCLVKKLRNPYDDDDAVHSEEYISLVFRRYGVELRPNIPATNITAQDLANSDKLQLVEPAP